MVFSESLGINVRVEPAYIYHASVTVRVLVSEQNLIAFHCVWVEYVFCISVRAEYVEHFVLVSEQNM